jgi:hypothetical protein
MTIRHTIAAVALSTAALLSGTAFAGNFASDLSEAKIASQTAGREIREAVTPALNSAQSLDAWGYHSGAQGYLTYARGMLGLPTSSAVVATPVVAAPMAADAGVGSFDQRLNEAKIASLSAGREIRDVVSNEISVAQSLSAQGNQSQAEGHLAFARGKLGLEVAQATNIGDVADYRPEAR